MSSAYTPGLQVEQKTVVTKTRELPLTGHVLVKVGDLVKADDVVLAVDLPGELEILKLPERMGVDTQDVLKGIKFVVGDKISVGQILCEVKSFFGWFTSSYKSSVDGVIEFVNDVNGHVGVRRDSVPLQIKAYISGTVTEMEEGKSVTIKTLASFIQGVFGVGGEKHGIITPLKVGRDEIISATTLQNLGTELAQAIVIGGSQFDLSALREAALRGVSAVVTGSIDSNVLYDFVGSRFNVSVTGDEDLPFTLVITEGLGKLDISNEIMELAKSNAGQFASVNGATQVRAGAVRPEIIIPLKSNNMSSQDALQNSSKRLIDGARIRLIRFPFFGELGTITALPPQPHEIATGAKVRVLKTKLDRGDEIIVPRSNVELIYTPRT